MLVWRIARERYTLDRGGSGGLPEGGRWHHAGLPVIHAGLTQEIAALEKLAHTGEHRPADLMLVRLSLPDTPALYERPAALPPGWNAIPPGEASAQFGGAFLREGRALGLIVASAIVPEARNRVINPLHPQFARA
ncbi:MAG: RES family NAD+ phosphorylase [Betaproteobacteria bacterium]|nr:RES family NAD+ phosphorylase [Betaproteobacteria bacterium]